MSAIIDRFVTSVDQAIMDDARYLPNGDLVRHSCHIQVEDGAAYVMVTWNADRLHLWPDGKPAADWRKGCVVWIPRGQAGPDPVRPDAPGHRTGAGR